MGLAVPSRAVSAPCGTQMESDTHENPSRIGLGILVTCRQRCRGSESEFRSLPGRIHFPHLCWFVIIAQSRGSSAVFRLPQARVVPPGRQVYQHPRNVQFESKHCFRLRVIPTIGDDARRERNNLKGAGIASHYSLGALTICLSPTDAVTSCPTNLAKSAAATLRSYSARNRSADALNSEASDSRNTERFAVPASA
jgi:hypothetical protein